jgi:hypothetical protein
MQPPKITRSSGKSNSEVIIEYVQGFQPGDTIQYQEFQKVLSEGIDKAYTRRQVQSAIVQANRALLRQLQRELRNVPNVGYRVAYAVEHMAMAKIRHRKGERQYERGLLTMSHARLEELTQPQREAHIAQLMISRAIVERVVELQNGQDRQQELIDNLLRRVDELEGRASGKWLVRHLAGQG